MSGFTGTGQLFRLAVRRDRIVGSAWILGLFVFAYSQAASIVSLYPTRADLDRLARTAGGIGANPAVVALQGPAYDASTYGGATAWQVVTPGVLLIGLMSILLVTRHTRQEEETGRAELVSSGVVGRYAWPAAGLLYVLAVNVVLAALCALGYVSQGLPAAGSVTLAAVCGLNGLVFAGLAAIAAQLTEYARPANGLALAALGRRSCSAPSATRPPGCRGCRGCRPSAGPSGSGPSPATAGRCCSCRRPCWWSCSWRRRRCWCGATSAPGRCRPGWGRPPPRPGCAARSAWPGGSSAAPCSAGPSGRPWPACPSASSPRTWSSSPSRTRRRPRCWPPSAGRAASPTSTGPPS